jgi:YVTN family beta-propeller protein
VSPVRFVPSAAAVTAAALALAIPAAGAAQQHNHPPAQQQPPAQQAPAPNPHTGHEGHPAPAADRPASLDQAAIQAAAVGQPVRAAADSAVTILRAAFAAAGEGGRAPTEKREVELRVRLTDPNTGRPAVGLRPTAWVDVRRDAGATPLDQCRQKVASFTESSLHVKHGQISIATPVEDLNGHYVMAMARSNAIAVIDPVKGFGRTKLFTAIALPSPGHDWAATPDDRRVFVSAPDSGVVSVIDTHSWRVERNLRAGPRPTRVAMDPAGRFLWVANASPTAWGVTVVDAEGLSIVKTLPTGAGPHAIAFSDDGALAFVTARGAGTVTIYDAKSFRELAVAATGAQPVDVAWSPVRNAAFVVNEGDGSVAVVDAATRAVTERLPFGAGVRSLRFAPEAGAHAMHAAPGGGGIHTGHASAPRAGRLAFVLNPRAGTLQIYDVVEKKVIRTLSGAPEPDQVTFTGQFAYIRAAGTPSVAMIPLANPTSGAIGPHDYFPAGTDVPGAIAADSLGAVLISQPGMHDAIYVANPKERMIYSYHYMEGMPVPHGGLTTYTFTPRSIRTVSRAMREVEPGVYAATVRIDRAGDYDLVLRHPDPYALGCYGFTVAEDPALHAADEVRIAPEGERVVAIGRGTVRFKLTGSRDGAPIEGLTDFRVQLAATSGWQQRSPARALGGGVYEAEFTVPEAGVYYAAFEIPSRGMTLRDGAPVSFEAKAP